MTQLVADIALVLDQAEVLSRESRYEEAVQLCCEVLLQDNGNLEALFLLGTIRYAQHDWHEAVKLFQLASEYAPNVGLLRVNLALALQESGQFDEALAAFDQAFELGESTANLYYNRGVLLQRLERMEQARYDFEQALAIDPTHVNSWVNLSAVCLATDDSTGTLNCCRHGLYLEPDNTALIANLAAGYSKLFRFEESLVWYQRMLELVQGNERAELLGRIANCLSDLYKVDESIACFERAIASSTDLFQKRALASTRLFVLHYSLRWSAAAISAEHRAWGVHYFPLTPIRQFANTSDPERPIRVAYLSPDLKIHAVVFFLQPVLAAHDPSQVIVYCYSDVKKPDAVTMQLREQHNVVWRNCAGLDDDIVLKMLAEDRIDILVELAGHTAGNRLPLLAQRAAPVQISWIGYPNTTGLTQVDYRISDTWADPPGLTEQLHAEELIRLPDSFLCYRPGADFPDTAPLPCLTNDYITFGSLSNFKKVTPEILDLWASILAAVPNSRLVFRARGLTVECFNESIAPLFCRYQVAPERITVLGHALSVVENLRDYQRIDIALDTFPYHGTTTTCESLCMGVPVVTLAGDSHVSRVGVSLLHTIGLPELIANTPEQYRAIAVALAGDVGRLTALRGTLRKRLLASPLADNVAFTRHVETAYRQVWQRWCKENRS